MFVNKKWFLPILLMVLITACSSESTEPEAEEPLSSEEGTKETETEEGQDSKEDNQESKQEETEVQEEDRTQENSQKTEQGSNSKNQQKGESATVTRVVDGDTLEVQMNGQEQDIRLLLVDTPETKHPSKPVEPFGPEASEFVKDKLNGEEVRIVPGVEKYDKYDRLLAYVFINGETIQEKLLKNGLARTAYLYNDLTMLDEFQEAQATAQEKEIGVWSIEGYAHADHDHGYHYEEKEKSSSNNTDEGSSPDSSNHDHYSHISEDHDCGDFNSADEATEFMNKSIEQGYGDHRLDGDGDGVACEG